MSLEGRAALVTGGSRGIGEAIARRLARDGAVVMVAARTLEAVSEVAGDLREEGLEAYAVRCDVTDPRDVRDMALSATEQMGRVDVLVNNAGRAHSNPLQRVSVDEWNDLIAVNATGTFLCTQAVLPGMIERGWGRVVNVASVAGLTGDRYISAYAASKHAQVGFTRAVAAEVAARGVTVNAVCPGYVDTEMTRESVDRIVKQTGMSSEEALEWIEGQSPQRRLIRPEEVAHAVASLCADEAAGINGEAVVIDGGALLG